MMMREEKQDKAGKRGPDGILSGTQTQHRVGEMPVRDIRLPPHPGKPQGSPLAVTEIQEPGGLSPSGSLQSQVISLQPESPCSVKNYLHCLRLLGPDPKGKEFFET